MLQFLLVSFIWTLHYRFHCCIILFFFCYFGFILTSQLAGVFSVDEYVISWYDIVTVDSTSTTARPFLISTMFSSYSKVPLDAMLLPFHPFSVRRMLWISHPLYSRRFFPRLCQLWSLCKAPMQNITEGHLKGIEF